jgi:hypothetical protein
MLVLASILLVAVLCVWNAGWENATGEPLTQNGKKRK